MLTSASKQAADADADAWDTAKCGYIIHGASSLDAGWLESLVQQNGLMFVVQYVGTSGLASYALRVMASSQRAALLHAYEPGVATAGTSAVKVLADPVCVATDAAAGAAEQGAIAPLPSAGCGTTFGSSWKTRGLSPGVKSLTKLSAARVAEKAPAAFSFLSSFSLAGAEMDALLASYNADSAAPTDMASRARRQACAWLKANWASAGLAARWGLSSEGYSPPAEVSLPEKCPAGSGVLAVGASQSCVTCPAGTSNDGTASALCISCAPGSYEPKVGSATCSGACPAGLSGHSGAVSQAECACDKGHYWDFGTGDCVGCPEGLDCVLGSTNEKALRASRSSEAVAKSAFLSATFDDDAMPESLPRVLPGFWAEGAVERSARLAAGAALEARLDAGEALDTDDLRGPKYGPSGVFEVYACRDAVMCPGGGHSACGAGRSELGCGECGTSGTAPSGTAVSEALAAYGPGSPFGKGGGRRDAVEGEIAGGVCEDCGWTHMMGGVLLVAPLVGLGLFVHQWQAVALIFLLNV